MIDLKKFKDMDRQSGRPEQMPGGSGFFPASNDLDPEDTQMRPPLELPQGDGPDDDDEWEIEDESAFSRLSHKLAKNPKIHDPDAVAATIGRDKYGQSGMTAKSVAGRKH